MLAPEPTFCGSVDVSAIVLEVLIFASSLCISLVHEIRGARTHKSGAVNSTDKTDVHATKRPIFPTQNGLHIHIARRTQSKSRKWTTRTTQTQHGEGNPPETQRQSTRPLSVCGNYRGCASHMSCVRALRFGEKRRNDVRGRSVNSVIVLATIIVLDRQWNFLSGLRKALVGTWLASVTAAGQSSRLAQLDG